MSGLYPWQDADWQRITGPGSARHHALVLGGIGGIGKREFALELARRLLCARPSRRACGECRNCQLFDAGTHPDFHVLLSEQESASGRLGLLTGYAARYPEERPGRERLSSVIKVEKIRQLIDRFYQSSHLGTGRVALLLPADRMNVNAANALLKLLEEPPPDSHFLLVTDRAGSLIPTIRSRCIMETLAPPSVQTSLEWLDGRGGENPALMQRAVTAGAGPLEILAMAETGELAQQDANLRSIQALLAGTEDPVALAEGFARQDPAQLLQWMQRLICQLARCQLAGSQSPWTDGAALPDRAPAGEALFALYDKISETRRLARDQLNLRLAVEEILISLRGLS